MKPVPFDLAAAMGAYPATTICVRCGGLIGAPHDGCPICGNALLERSVDADQLAAAFKRMEEHIDRFNCRLKLVGGDVVNPVRDWEQIERLFQAARFLDMAATPPATARKKKHPEHTAMGRFMGLLSSARQFVHFNTVGMSELFVGFLKALSYREGVSVRGIVSQPDSPALIEPLTSVADAPDFEVHVFELDRARPPQLTEMVVIDGIVALRGAAPFSAAAWRHILRDRVQLELLTAAPAIVDLNNRAFAPFFGASSLIEGWNVYEGRREMIGRTWTW